MTDLTCPFCGRGIAYTTDFELMPPEVALDGRLYYVEKDQPAVITVEPIVGEAYVKLINVVTIECPCGATGDVELIHRAQASLTVRKYRRKVE